MKYIIKFIFCCFAVVPTSSRCKGEDDLVQLTYAGRDKKRRKRSNSGSQWRPSLCAISEDNVVASAKSAASRKVKSGNRFAGDSRSRVRSYDRSNEKNFRGESMQGVIPAFSPTAILF